eukprot:scaffold1764_cov236-Pinguiococcus_pyrenoidosus.AAC.10
MSLMRKHFGTRITMAGRERDELFLEEASEEPLAPIELLLEASDPSPDLLFDLEQPMEGSFRSSERLARSVASKCDAAS